MGYEIRTAGYEDYADILKTEEEYVHKLFLKNISQSEPELWYDYCFNNSDSTQREMKQAIITFVSNLDPDLMCKVENRVQERNLSLEVSNHFSQDKSELELWQDFEGACSAEAEIDAYDYHFPNEF